MDPISMLHHLVPPSIGGLDRPSFIHAYDLKNWVPLFPGKAYTTRAAGFSASSIYFSDF